MPAMPIMFSRRVSASRGVLAWTVLIEPSWPVFIACSMSSASSPRHSPMMMRSGRIRSAFFNRSRIVISPVPSRLAVRVSRRTTCGCCSCNSAASSIVTVRSAPSIMRDSALSSVVLPEPVPPEIRMLSRQRAAIFSTVAIAGEMLAPAAIVSRVMLFFENLRIEIDAAAIRQTGVDQRPRLVDAPPDPGHDLGRDVHQMLVVAELHIGQFELAAPLDVDLLWPVDHDVVDGLVGDQRLEGSEPQHVRDQRLDEFALFDEVELDLGLGQQLLDPAGKLRLEGGARHFGGGRDVHVFEDE